MGVNSSCCQEEDLAGGAKEPPEVVDSYHKGGSTPSSCSSAAGSQGASGIPASNLATVEASHAPHAPSKWSRLQHMKHLEVDADIVRGISLQGCLRGLGHLWRQSPIDLPEEGRRHLYERSSPVGGYDIFLSHTWQTPGRYKVLSLLFQAGWKHMLLGQLIGVVSAGLLSRLHVLPMPLSFVPAFPDYAGECPFFPWCLIVGLLGSFLGLLLAPYSPHPGKRPMCFLDVVSIHQVDQELMERGIYGLGGFLRVSKELRVLWSAPYLSRLWCVFELAAYRMANPEGRTVLAPIFVEAGTFLCLVATYIAAGLFDVGFAFGWTNSGAIRVLSYLFALTPIYVLMHLFRRSNLAKLKLVSDLRTFDLERAECRTDFDREFIHRAIVEWYGSKDLFTQYVRGPLRGELLAKRELMPLQYLLLITAVTFSASLDSTIALARAGVPGYWVACWAISATFGFFVCWFAMMLRLCVFLCDRFSAPMYPGTLADCFQSLVLFAIGCGFYYGGAELCRIAYLAGLEAATLWASAACLLAVFSFFADRLCTRADSDMPEARARGP